MTDRSVPCRLCGVTDTPDIPQSRSGEPALSSPAGDTGPYKRPYGTGTVRQRGPDHWQLRVRVTDPDGGPSRQVTKTVVGTREEAERALIRFAVTAQIDDGRRRTRGDTLSKVMEGYLKHCEIQELAPMTIYGYGREWSKVANDLGHQYPATMRPMRATDYLTKRHDGGLPASTVNAIIRLLRAACNWAVGQEMIGSHPFSKVKLLPTAKAAITSPSDGQVAAVYAQALNDDMLIAVAVRLAAVMGSRRGELPAQRWTDIDPDGHRVRRHAAASTPPRPRDTDGKSIGTAAVVVRKTKTDVDTWHPVDEGTIELLRNYRSQCEARSAAHGVELAEDAFVLSNEPDGTRPVRPDAITKRTREVAERVPGAESVRPKHLRKWAATILATEATAAVAQARLDHADPQTTLKHYVARNESAEREAATRLGEHLDEGYDAA